MKFQEARINNKNVEQMKLNGQIIYNKEVIPDLDYYNRFTRYENTEYFNFDDVFNYGVQNNFGYTQSATTDLKSDSYYISNIKNTTVDFSKSYGMIKFKIPPRKEAKITVRYSFRGYYSKDTGILILDNWLNDERTEDYYAFPTYESLPRYGNQPHLTNGKYIHDDLSNKFYDWNSQATNVARNKEMETHLIFGAFRQDKGDVIRPESINLGYSLKISNIMIKYSDL